MPSFMDKLRGTVDRGVVSISAKSKELIEITQVRNTIRQMEQERAGLVQRLGETTYSMIKKGEFELTAIQPLISSIDALAQRMAEANARIAELQEATKRTMEAARAFTEEAFAVCTCGGGLRENSVYCPQCGRDVTQIVTRALSTRIPAPPRPPQAACSRCGRPLPTGARFCAACGGSTGSRPTPPPPHAPT